MPTPRITREYLDAWRGNPREQPIIVRQAVEDSEASFIGFTKFFNDYKHKFPPECRKFLEESCPNFIQEKSSYPKFEATAYTMLLTMFQFYLKKRFNVTIRLDDVTQKTIKNTKLFLRKPSDTENLDTIDPENEKKWMAFTPNEKIDLFNAWFFDQVVEPQ